MSWHEWREVPEGDYAVVGDPVKHSRSPQMHAAAYRVLGLDLVYRAVRVPRGELRAAFERMRELGYKGVNVTVPLKEEAFTWCSKVEGIGAVVGAVNTVDLATGNGINTDAPGFLRTLRDLGVAPGSRVLCLGAGGTARSLIPAMVGAGYEVKAWNRTEGKLEDLKAETAADFEILDIADPAGCLLILNTTSASLAGSSLPVEWNNAFTGATVYDAMYSSTLTTFLGDAAAHGLRTVDGRGLLVEQGALSFEWWIGKEAPRGAMLGAVHERS